MGLCPSGRGLSLSWAEEQVELSWMKKSEEGIPDEDNMQESRGQKECEMVLGQWAKELAKQKSGRK